MPMAIKPMCSSVLPRAAIAGAGLFTVSWTQVTQSQWAICIDMQRFAGVKRLWLQLTTHRMSKRLERLWERQKVLMGQSLQSFNMQQRGKLLTVTANISKSKLGVSCLEGFENRTLNDVS
jgi:hypothetical protein